MLSIALLREQKTAVVEGLLKKHYHQAAEEVDKILAIDESRRKLQVELEALLSESNQLARSIGELMKLGQKQEAEVKKLRTAELKGLIKNLELQVQQKEEEQFQLLVKLPNLPHISVPQGKTAEDNKVVKAPASLPGLPASALPHWDLIVKFNIIDFELGNKISGAGFPVYKGKGARLQRALINFFLDEAVNAGYTEIQPPILINKDSGFGTGQLPDKDGQMYYMPEDELYLIPTAEVPITNIYRDAVLKKEDLPIKNVGYTPCFRREAGSWGAHVRGLNRLHQFDKVEIVQITHPENSYQILDEMVAHVEKLLQKLELPYRILQLCGGDMSFSSALTYDFEVYSAAQKRWLEVSSVSNFETFQSNRMKCRFKGDDGKNHLAHTLNGSALALPRIVAALLENNQAESSIKLPAVIHSYLGFSEIS